MCALCIQRLLTYIVSWCAARCSSLSPLQALIDGPANLTGVRRQVINFKWLALTTLTVKVQLNARQKALTAAWKAGDVQAKFAASSWGKRMTKKATTAALDDFGRFKVKVQKQKVSAAVKKAVKA
jgi:large subunit ribosomal protein L14e